MGKVKIEYFKCDVCGKKNDCHYLPDSWVTYYYAKSWSSGSHSGKHDKEFLACFKCVDSRSVFKKMFDFLKDNK